MLDSIKMRILENVTPFSSFLEYHDVRLPLVHSVSILLLNLINRNFYT